MQATFCVCFITDEILNEARDKDVCLLVVGDPFGATTHADLVLRAKSLKIDVQIIHNASIVNAVGCCGLQVFHDCWSSVCFIVLKNEE